MKSILRILVFLSLLSTYGISQADNCDKVASEPERYDSVSAQRIALKQAQMCSIQSMSAVVVLLKIQIEVAKALEKEPRNTALAGIKTRIDASMLEYNAMAIKFHARARKIEADMPLIIAPEGGYLRQPGDRIM